ncbi:hypothetical protein TNCV_5060381 [Trichonephila clavipes]|nr:hypothetical protein TNCV_5060381 [Trichonephila clavipes]
MSYDYMAFERSIQCLFGFSALGKIKFLEQVSIVRALVPPSGEETGCQNYLLQLVSPIDTGNQEEQDHYSFQSWIFIIIVCTENKTNAGSMCFLVLNVELCFATTPSLRPLLATLLCVEVKPSTLVSSLEMFLRVPRFSEVAFSVGMGVSPSKRDAADNEDSVMTVNEPCAAVTWY